MAKIDLNVIYMSHVGKTELRAARASGYLEKSITAETTKERAIAEICAEQMMPVARISYGSDWIYINTERFDGRKFHHFKQSDEKQNENHVWLDANALNEDKVD